MTRVLGARVQSEIPIPSALRVMLDRRDYHITISKEQAATFEQRLRKDIEAAAREGNASPRARL
jgi:hypothetical protein